MTAWTHPSDIFFFGAFRAICLNAFAFVCTFFFLIRLMPFAFSVHSIMPNRLTGHIYLYDLLK